MACWENVPQHTWPPLQSSGPSQLTVVASQLVPVHAQAVPLFVQYSEPGFNRQQFWLGLQIKVEGDWSQ